MQAENKSSKNNPLSSAKAAITSFCKPKLICFYISARSWIIEHQVHAPHYQVAITRISNVFKQSFQSLNPRTRD